MNTLIMTNKNKCLICNKHAFYNIVGEKYGNYCIIHKQPNMINVVNKTCLSCDKRPSFNFKGEIAIYCAEHKEPNMINVVTKTCLSCDKRPVFNIKGKKNAIYCYDHKEPNMIDVKNKTCLSCDKRPTFNIKGKKNAIYCYDHKEPNMINVIDKTCLSCDKRPGFNFKGKKAIYCAEHKEPNMINVVTKTCLSCDKRPVFNIIGTQFGIYCAEHKEPNMINVVTKTCLSCDKRPNFNTIDKLNGIYCAEHKEPNMIDVTHHKCNICNIRANFGIPGNKPNKCSSHKDINMIYNPTKKCVECKQNIAIYGYDSHTHCENCAKDDMTNFVEQKCISCGLLNIVDNNKLCRYCDPLTIQSRNKKENDIYTWLLANNYNVLSHDKMIDNGSCIRNRPDIILQSTNLLYHVIVEVDENQHKYYNEICECTRMINITQALSTPVIFIRYNPNNFKINNKNVTIINNIRLNTLKSWLDNALNKIDEEIQRLGLISVIHLFYDEYDKTNTSYITIQQFENI